MFHDLDATLKKILDDTAAPAELRNAAVSFETPQKAYAPAMPTVNLFLYEVKENQTLRDPVPIVERVGATYVRRQPPIRVDCAYIVTAWSNKTGAAKVVEEHQLLSQALMWLSRFPTIPAQYLQASLAGQPFPPPVLMAQLPGNGQAGDFWNALEVPPRPTFHLLATIALDLQPRSEGALVTTVNKRLAPGAGATPETHYQIGGYVLGPSGQIIRGATVELAGTGFRAQTDAEGRYLFTRAPAGTRTLNAQAAGYNLASKSITIPGSTQDYTITLTPTG